MNKIRQNISFTFMVAVLVAMAGVFVISGSLPAAEPDSLSLKIEKPGHIITKTVNNRKNTKTVSFTEKEAVSESGNNSFSDENEMKSNLSNQKEDNLQESYTGRTIFGAALSIIYKLVQYFL